MKCNEELEQLTKSIGFILINTSMRIKDELRKGFGEQGYDVTPDQFAVLIRLWKEDGLSQKELSERTLKTKSNITRILDSMEKKELIVRQTNKEDRRSFSIVLTNKGENLRTELISIAIDMNNKIFKGITSEEKKKLLGILEKIAINLE